MQKIYIQLMHISSLHLEMHMNSILNSTYKLSKTSSIDVTKSFATDFLSFKNDACFLFHLQNGQ